MSRWTEVLLESLSPCWDGIGYTMTPTPLVEGQRVFPCNTACVECDVFFPSGEVVAVTGYGESRLRLLCRRCREQLRARYEVPE